MTSVLLAVQFHDECYSCLTVNY